MARARVKTARARLEAAANECSRALLRSPCAARVLRVNVQAGELTGPDSTEPPLILADTSRLFVRAYVDEFDAPRVEIGMRARVAADGLRAFEAQGQVVRLAPRMTQKPLRTDDPQERFDTKVREIWIELDEAGAEKLVIGLPVDIVLIGGEAESSESDLPTATPLRDIARAAKPAPTEAGAASGLPEITPVKSQ
ncbi:MAG TPA: HlyD family efflux transporter periplasmic adaptor subunit [Thermomicrobiales bacterium]|nr:HlyD family efflux transporter periplasmic adaptor subunit [Thermomicrobiales bacterium]